MLPKLLVNSTFLLTGMALHVLSHRWYKYCDVIFHILKIAIPIINMWSDIDVANPGYHSLIPAQNNYTIYFFMSQS